MTKTKLQEIRELCDAVITPADARVLVRKTIPLLLDVVEKQQKELKHIKRYTDDCGDAADPEFQISKGISKVLKETDAMLEGVVV